MDSSMDMTRLARALEMQLAEGVDEWILPYARSRFQEAAAQKEGKREAAISQTPERMAERVEKPASEPEVKPVNFDQCESASAIEAALLSALPNGLTAQFHEPIADLGALNAEIAVITDPPFREATQQSTLLGDEAVRLLRKSLQAIDLDLDASLGHEPRAALRILPISPWRMPQDRKFVEAESVLMRQSIKARLALGSHRAVFLAGSNLAGLENEQKDGTLFGLPVFELVSPRIMLKEPLLKRVHWQRLLEIHKKLDEVLKL